MLLSAFAAGANPNQPLDRPYTLRNAELFLLEQEYHRFLSAEGKRSYIFPKPCLSPLDAVAICGGAGIWRYLDSARQRDLALGPVAGFVHRRSEEDVEAVDFGVLIAGRHGPVSFILDARMFTELHEDAGHLSYDR